MRSILRQHEWISDPWYDGEDTPAEHAPRIVSCAELCDEPGRWLNRSGPLGVQLAPADDAERILEHLPHLALVALEFPNFADGRGFTQAAVLRRNGFTGELRGVGAGVKQDLLYLMLRCGIDTFELAAGEDPEHARRALKRYTVAYQPSLAGADPSDLRFAPAQTRPACTLSSAQ